MKRKAIFIFKLKYRGTSTFIKSKTPDRYFVNKKMALSEIKNQINIWRQVSCSIASKDFALTTVEVLQ